ncbi:MAG: hypothetical protein GX198_03655 [Epulopiscium sp.]|nr:hypothetical protein [Candidatus Epulonipiscium sp.]
MNAYIEERLDFYNQKLEESGQPTTAHHYNLIRVLLYWLAGEMESSNRNAYFKNALKILGQLINENATDIRLSFASIYLNLKLEEYENAYEILKPLLKYKKYYENSNKIYYGLMHYFKALLDYYNGKHMFIQKSIKIFEASLEATRSPLLYFLKANLEKELFLEEKNEISFYYKAYKSGFRSPFLYHRVYQLFCSNPDQFYNMNDMLMAVFTWALRYDFLDEKALLLFSERMLQTEESLDIPESYIRLAQKRWDNNNFLSLLCKKYIKKNKRDKEAFNLFSEAIDKKLYVEGLYQAYAETAKNMDYSDIPVTSLHPIFLGSLEKDVLAYVYSLICKKTKYKSYYQINMKRVYDFGIQALKAGKKGKYYIDIYMKLLENNPNHTQLKKTVFEHLFLYEVKVNSPFIKYLWIIENEKEKMTTYTISRDSLYIEAAADKKEDLTVLCVGQRQKSFYPDKLLTIYKLIKDVPFELLLKYYDEDYKTTNLLIALTRYFIKMTRENIEISIPQKAGKIMTECLENSSLSDSFRKETSAALGTVLVKNQQFDKAFLYFEPLSFNDLSPCQVEYAIAALLEGGEINKAILWAQAANELSNEINFKLIKKAIEKKLIHSYVINTAYQLLIKGKYDEEILNYVIENYQGSMEDWYRLRDHLAALDKSSLLLDKKILQKGIWTRSLTTKLEEVFQSLCKRKSPISKAFVDYCNYEVLINKKILSDTTLMILEDVFEKTKSMILASSLIYNYGKKNMDLTDKEEMIQGVYLWMKNNDFLLPIFKEKKDIFPYSAYIEQNVPFIYYTKGGREVYFCYKIKGFPLNKKKMYNIAFNLYGTAVSLFYNESMEYYIEETDEEGNILLTDVKLYQHEIKNISKEPKEVYEKLNNAIIFNHESNFEKAEEILEELILEDKRNNVGYLL